MSRENMHFEIKQSVLYAMANTMIVLLHMILSLWIVIEACSPRTNSHSKNYKAATEKKSWADNQIEKAQKKCKEYVQYACRYQTSFHEKYFDKDQILNGEHVPEGMLPHMALIIVKRKNLSAIMNDVRCTGTLISEKFVMSAGHCVHYTVEIEVKLGSLYRTNDGTGKWYDVERIYAHPQLSFDYLLNDIVLLELSKKVHFSAHIRPICLNTEYKGDYSRIIASGWGRTEDSRLPERLKMTELQVKGKSLEMACRTYIESRKYSDILKIQTICGGEMEKQQDTCKGDSGGPLQIPMKSECPNTYEQIGITSFGEGNCLPNTKSYIGLYVKVEHFVPWIANIVWPDH